ncbi:MAG TPA: DUF2520 domain-containing protein, partial [Segetibacter sp.]
MKVVIIGSGNVASVLGQRIKAAGNGILQVIGRNQNKAAVLAAHLECSFSTNLLEINTSADLYIIAVSDNAIESIANQIKIKDRLIVHTAAAVSMEALSVASKNYGILYPLQTLKTGISEETKIPIVINGNNAENLDKIKIFSENWVDSVTVATDEERLKIHVAAVFVSNFTNHLFTVAEKYCNEEHLNFNALYPLIEETIRRIEQVSPALVQTGPAVRADTNTIQKHQQLLTAYPKINNLY